MTDTTPPTSTPTEQRHHLVTLGVTDHQADLIQALNLAWWTNIHVDLTSDSVDPAMLLLETVDATNDDPAVIALGPGVFGFASAGRLADLRDWTLVRHAPVELVVCPDRADGETLTQTSNVMAAVRAATGLDLDHTLGVSALWEMLAAAPRTPPEVSP